MKKYLISLNLLIFIFIISSACFAVNYETYSNDNFGYKIQVPKLWKKTVLDNQDKHQVNLLKDINTSIIINVMKSEKDDIESVIHQKIWDLRKADPNLNSIIETGNLQLNENLTGKFLLFEYRLKNSCILQRTLVTKNGEYIYIIECRSPVSCFYKFEEIFTNALKSFMITGSGDAGTPEENSEKDNGQIENEENTDNAEGTEDNLEEEKF